MVFNVVAFKNSFETIGLAADIINCRMYCFLLYMRLLLSRQESVLRPDCQPET